MNAAEKRDIVTGGLRSFMRSQGIDPVEATNEVIERVLDERGRKEMFLVDGRTVVGEFALNCSENQFRLFMQDFRRWQRQLQRDRRLYAMPHLGA